MPHGALHLTQNVFRQVGLAPPAFVRRDVGLKHGHKTECRVACAICARLLRCGGESGSAVGVVQGPASLLQFVRIECRPRVEDGPLTCGEVSQLGGGEVMQVSGKVAICRSAGEVVHGLGVGANV